MNKIYWMILIGLLTLSGCTPGPLGGTVSYGVDNNNENAGRGLCTGGLEGQLSSGDFVMFESPLIPKGETYIENKVREGVDEGDRVTGEAWCYDTEGSEVGYIKVSGRLIASYSVGVSFVEPLDAINCLKPDEVRGIAPCIDSSIIEQ